METKVWYQSKTIWINAITILLAILTLLLTQQANGGLPFNLDARWVILGLGVLNIVLRSVTDQPVTLNKSI